MQNHPVLIIPNQKINTNTKSSMLLTQPVLYYQINCNNNTTIAILSHKKNCKNTYGALTDNYEKVSSVLVIMYCSINFFS